MVAAATAGGREKLTVNSKTHRHTHTSIHNITTTTTITTTIIMHSLAGCSAATFQLSTLVFINFTFALNTHTGYVLRMLYRLHTLASLSPSNPHPVPFSISMSDTLLCFLIRGILFSDQSILRLTSANL